MRIIFLILIAVGLQGCGISFRTGKTRGKVVDVTWEGWFFKSCEMDVQYGDQSSRIEDFSSRSYDTCQNLLQNLGKTVEIEYDKVLFSLTTSTRDIVKKIDMLE